MGSASACANGSSRPSLTACSAPVSIYMCQCVPWAVQLVVPPKVYLSTFGSRRALPSQHQHSQSGAGKQAASDRACGQSPTRSRSTEATDLFLTLRTAPMVPAPLKHQEAQDGTR